MQRMIARSGLGMTAVALTGVIALGAFAPQPAQASDAGRAIAGIVAGALVYELLDNHQPSHRGQHYQADTKYRRGQESQNRRRGFWTGNRGDRGGYYRPPSPPRPQYHPRSNYRQGYRHGYNNGWGDGYNTGYGDGRRDERWGGWSVGWGWGCY